MGDCELCGATKVSTREHRVNKAMLALCQRCVGQMNLAPKQEAPGLAQARRYAFTIKSTSNEQTQHYGETRKRTG